MGIDAHRSIWSAESFGFELIECTIGDLLDTRADQLGSHEALVCRGASGGPGLRWSYAELRHRVDEVARGLLAAGIEAGDRVAVLAPNLPEWILLEYALAKVGAVLVTANTACRAQELGYLLHQGRVRALFTVASYRGSDYLELLSEARAEWPLRGLDLVILIGGDPRPGTLDFAALRELGRAVPAEILRARQAAVRAGDVVQIQYTSGTTGAPKGVMLTHHGTLNNANLMRLRAGWTERDRLLAAMPLFHTAGCVCNVLGMLTCGGTLLSLMAFDAAEALAVMRDERATVMNGVPTMFLRLLAEPGVRSGHYRGSTLHTAFMGGTTIPAVVLEDMRTAFGANPMVIMGMTEASPLITQTLPGDDFVRCSTTAGLPLPFTSLKVVDRDGRTVSLGQEGELCVRGYGVTPGYFDLPERTAEAIDAEGWLRSGDLATLDAGGYLRIVGRIKDMIIRGGENLYPAEIEELMMRDPLVEQVQVVGVPDAELGEEAFAFVVGRPGATLTEAGLRDACRARFSRHKVPRYIELVDALPQTASGKIKKFELRERARAIVEPR